MIIKGYSLERLEVASRANIPQKNGFRDDLELAKAWLRDCETVHPRCCASEAFEMPSRLIDDGCVDPPSCVKLCEGMPSNTQYASLSHSWGSHQPLTLLNSNISQLKTRIELADLPKTFHDAIGVARRLNIRYLWIDSLCIMQDSENDWLKESALMY